jgi:hypothetical protein
VKGLPHCRVPSLYPVSTRFVRREYPLSTRLVPREYSVSLGACAAQVADLHELALGLVARLRVRGDSTTLSTP